MIGLGKPHQAASFKVAIFSLCRNIKGNPQFWEATLAQGHAHFFFGYDFMMVLGKPKPHTNFEVGSFSRCKHIKEKPQNFRELP